MIHSGHTSPDRSSYRLQSLQNKPLRHYHPGRPFKQKDAGRLGCACRSRQNSSLAERPLTEEVAVTDQDGSGLPAQTSHAKLRGRQWKRTATLKARKQHLLAIFEKEKPLGEAHKLLHQTCIFGMASGKLPALMTRGCKKMSTVDEGHLTNVSLVFKAMLYVADDIQSHSLSNIFCSGVHGSACQPILSPGCSEDRAVG